MEYPHLQPLSQYMPTAPTAVQQNSPEYYFQPSSLYQPYIATPIILQPNYILPQQATVDNSAIISHQPSKIN